MSHQRATTHHVFLFKTVIPEILAEKNSSGGIQRTPILNHHECFQSRFFGTISSDFDAVDMHGCLSSMLVFGEMTVPI